MEVPSNPEESVTTRLENGTIAVPKELLEKAGIHDGDELYVEVDENGSLIVERTRFYESGEEFLASIRARADVD